jgi:hypothetical protein
MHNYIIYMYLISNNQHYYYTIIDNGHLHHWNLLLQFPHYCNRFSQNMDQFII